MSGERKTLSVCRMVGIVLFAVLMVWVPGWAGTEIAEVTPKPWSGYWWPFLKGGLVTGQDFDGRPAPIDKYDAAMHLMGSASRWEMDNHFDPDGATWYGHCSGWAAAAVREAEPSQKVVQDGIVFYAADFKGLLTEVYLGATGARYGTRYRGEGDDFSDIDPLTFQEVLQLFLRDNNTPIIMDEDPGVEVWSYPIYRYELNTSDEGSVRHCTMKVYCATDFVAPDVVGTVDHIKEYTYDLTLDTSGVPQSGKWTEGSVDDHPDYLRYPDALSTSDVFIANPYVKLDDVKSIMAGSYSSSEDDSYEMNNTSQEASQMPSPVIGRPLDEDWFSFFTEPNEVMHLQFYSNGAWSSKQVSLFENGTSNGDKLVWTDNILDKSKNVTVGGDIQDNFWIQNMSYHNIDDNYMIQLTRVSGEDAVPHLTNSAYWDNNLYLTKNDWSDANGTEVSVVGMGSDADGLASPISGMNPLVLTDNHFEYLNLTGLGSSAEWIRLNTLSPGQVKYFELFKSGGEGSLAIISNQKPSLVFMAAHIPSEVNYWWYGMVLLNPNRFKPNHVICELWGLNGEILKEKTFEFAPGEKIVGVFSELFPEVNQTEVSYIKMSAANPINAVALYGTNNHSELSYIPMQAAPMTSPFYVLPDAFQGEDGWHGIVLVNPSSGFVTVKAIWHLRNFTSESQVITLQGHEKWVGLIDELKPADVEPEDVAYLEIVPSGKGIYGFELGGSHQKGILTSLPWISEGKARELSVPLFTRSGMDVEVNIKSFKGYSKTISLSLFDGDGVLINKVFVDVGVYEMRSVKPEDLWTTEQLSNSNCLLVEAPEDIYPYAYVVNTEGSMIEAITP